MNNKKITFTELKDKVVLITGGTGSFGKNFSKFLLENTSIKKLIIFSRDEQKHFEMAGELNDKRIRFFVGDIRDYQRLLLASREVNVIIHAAAMKHVPISEYNPMECIKTNINGTDNVINAAIQNKVNKVLALSTDKAVNPINLYGSTKLAADKLIVAANNLSGNIKTVFSIVRYGNIISSKGSVIPMYKKMIENGKKILPLTDKNMTRFFMKLDEATNFVIFCLSNMKGGEVFIPKLPSVRILDIIQVLGCEPELIGIRPGEKIFETLCPEELSFDTIEFKNFFCIKPNLIFGSKRNYLSYKNEIGKKVDEKFSYNSSNNKDFVDNITLKRLLK
tara:strand:+ start:561 stop:1565 length:1005 start_codon:yes stop_codon:yes gene_type:complete